MQDRTGGAESSSASCSRWPRPGGGPARTSPWPAWQQAVGKLRAAIEAGELTPGDALPSVPGLARLQGLKPGTVRHMFIALAEAGLVHIRHGRTTTSQAGPRATPGPADSILSGAFEAAERWEWVDRNPVDSARPPTVRQKKRPATPPADVVNVIDQARAAGQHNIALHLWLVAITGVRRGELCAVQPEAPEG